MQNKQFSILEVIAILLVIIGHLGDIRFLHLGEIFPAYGYHMALFVFISGYFYKPQTWQSVPKWLWHKTKRLALPLIGWNMVYAIIVYALQSLQMFDFLTPIQPFTLHNLIVAPFTHGHQYILNLATWFVGSLLLTQVVYCLIHTLLHSRLSLLTEQLIYLAIAAITVLLCNRLGAGSEYVRPLIKIGFFLHFFHLGHYYHEELESKDTIPNRYLLPCLIVVQISVYFIFGYTYYNVALCNFLGRYLLPFVTSLIGIMFWLRIARIISPWIHESRFLNFAAANTWSIMTHHLLVLLAVNYVLLKVGLSDFDLQQFRTNAFYYASGLPKIVYVALLFFVPLLWQYLFNKIIKQPIRLLLAYIKSLRQHD